MGDFDRVVLVVVLVSVDSDPAGLEGVDSELVDPDPEPDPESELESGLETSDTEAASRSFFRPLALLPWSFL